MKFYDSAGMIHSSFISAIIASIKYKIKNRNRDIKPFEDDYEYDDLDVRDLDPAYTCMCGHVRSDSLDPIRHCDICDTDAVFTDNSDIVHN